MSWDDTFVKKMIERWEDEDMVLHNPRGASRIVTTSSGIKTVEHHMVCGKYHRDDGPAYHNHSREYFEFWLHGKRYRFDGWLKKVKDKNSKETYERLKEGYGD